MLSVTYPWSYRLNSQFILTQKLLSPPARPPAHRTPLQFLRYGVYYVTSSQRFMWQLRTSFLSAMPFHYTTLHTALRTHAPQKKYSWTSGRGRWSLIYPRFIYPTSANPTNYRAGENPKKIMASPNPVPSAYSNLRIRGSEQSPYPSFFL